MKSVTQKLTEDGVASFAESFNGLIEVIKGRTEELRRAPSNPSNVFRDPSNSGA